MRIRCAWCLKPMGFKFVRPLFAVSHGICDDCIKGVNRNHIDTSAEVRRLRKFVERQA